MQTCFVMQPFDSGRFDKRYEDVFRPAIIDAGLTPYRVDSDPKVDVLVNAIHDGIKQAVICLAEITQDNPNVWYELGYADAIGKPIVMICGEERESKKFPFDVQHRKIIKYKSESLRDFESLKSEITERILALIKQGEVLRTFEIRDQMVPIQGLTQAELACLTAIVSGISHPDDWLAIYSAKREFEMAGFTPVAFNIGSHGLRNKLLIKIREEADWNGNPEHQVQISLNGWEWITKNQNLFAVKPPPTNPRHNAIPDSDIPF